MTNTKQHLHFNAVKLFIPVITSSAYWQTRAGTPPQRPTVCCGPDSAGSRCTDPGDTEQITGSICNINWTSDFLCGVIKICISSTSVALHCDIIVPVYTQLMSWRLVWPLPELGRSSSDRPRRWCPYQSSTSRNHWWIPIGGEMQNRLGKVKKMNEYVKYNVVSILNIIPGVWGGSPQCWWWCWL